MTNELTGNPPKKHPNTGGRAGNGKRNFAGRPATHVSWSEVANQLLRDAIVAITDAGGAFLIGRTSDGGALSMQVLDGDERIKEYPHTVDECEALLRWLISMYSSD